MQIMFEICFVYCSGVGLYRYRNVKWHYQLKMPIFRVNNKHFVYSGVGVYFSSGVKLA